MKYVIDFLSKVIERGDERKMVSDVELLDLKGFFVGDFTNLFMEWEGDVVAFSMLGKKIEPYEQIQGFDEDGNPITETVTPDDPIKLISKKALLDVQNRVNVLIDGDRLSNIKAECSKRIFAVASANAQTNMALASGLLSPKIATDTATDEEKALFVALGMASKWANDMISRVSVLVQSDEDYTLDDAWLPVPSEVVAVAGRF